MADALNGFSKAMLDSSEPFDIWLAIRLTEVAAAAKEEFKKEIELKYDVTFLDDGSLEVGRDLTANPVDNK